MEGRRTSASTLNADPPQVIKMKLKVKWFSPHYEEWHEDECANWREVAFELMNHLDPVYEVEVIE